MSGSPAIGGAKLGESTGPEGRELPTFTYFYKVRVDMQKFSSGKQLLDKWHQEAQAASGAMEAGIAQIWKDAAEPLVYVILNIEAENQTQAHGSVLEIFASLPMGASGELVIEEGRQVIPYREWAEYLAGR